MKDLGTVEHGSEPSVRGPETWQYINRCIQQGNADRDMYQDLKKRIHCEECTKHYLDYLDRNSRLDPFEFFLCLYNEVESRKIKEGGKGKTISMQQYAKILGVNLSN